MVRSTRSTRRTGAVMLPLVGCSAIVAGLALLFIGWWRISGESTAARQLPYLASASIPGAALVIVGALALGMWWRSESDQRVDLLYRLLTEAEPSDEQGAPTAAAIRHDVFVTVPGTLRYHRRDCSLVIGKPIEPVVGVGTPEQSLLACPICTPDA